MPQLHVPGAPDNTFAQAIQASIGLMLTPQLYRGYVYAAVGDMYTYYLGSRYYVTQLCRFFNADKHSDTQTGVLATNMFAYCNNNPVMNVDPTGESLSFISRLLNVCVKIINAIKNVFTKKVSYGAAKSYVVNNNENVNCYGYALGIDEYLNPNKDENIKDYSLENIAKLVEKDFKTKLKPRTIRRIKSIDTKINANEYRIALRVGSNYVYGNLIKDYHFMVQHNDGYWSHKPGGLPSRKMEKGENPDNITWDLYGKNYDGSEVVIYTNFYDSKTIYFAATWS